MNISEARRLKLLEAVKAVGGEARFVEAYDVSQAQLWQWLNRRRNIGEKAARKLEEKIGKPAGWLDSEQDMESPTEPTAGLSAAAIRLIKQIERLDKEDRLSDDLAKAIANMLKLAPPPKRQVAYSTGKPLLPNIVGGKTVAEARAEQAKYEGEQRLRENADFYHDEASDRISEIHASQKKGKAPKKPEAGEKT